MAEKTEHMTEELAELREPAGRTIGELETTLGDLGERDRDNFAYVLKSKSKMYCLENYQKAVRFMGQALNTIMQDCGVRIYPGMTGEAIELVQARAGVKVEHRRYPPGEEVYLTGLYIYKGNEIAGFVSSPMKADTILDLGPRTYIRTTARMDTHEPILFS